MESIPVHSQITENLSKKASTEGMSSVVQRKMQRKIGIRNSHLAGLLSIRGKIRGLDSSEIANNLFLEKCCERLAGSKEFKTSGAGKKSQSLLFFPAGFNLLLKETLCGPAAKA